MSIEWTSINTSDGITVITATSDLPSPCWLHWYIDGGYVGRSCGPTASRSFQVQAEQQARVDVLDTADDDFDPLANAPETYPPRVLLEWERSPTSDVVQYAIYESENAGAYTLQGYVLARANQYRYRYQSRRLIDGASYSWKIIALRANGAADSGLIIGLADASDTTQPYVRRPDAPSYGITYDSDRNRVTFVEA